MMFLRCTQFEDILEEGIKKPEKEAIATPLEASKDSCACTWQKETGAAFKENVEETLICQSASIFGINPSGMEKATEV